MTFADMMVSDRKTDTKFFDQIAKLIDFSKLEKTINKYYQFSNDAAGNSSWSGLLLFKVNLLATWYKLSDEQVEIQVNDRISFSKFVSLPLDKNCPDHSTIWRFRERMKEAGAWDKLLNAVNEQLEKHKVIVKEGVNIDASISESPNKPKGALKIVVAEDREEDNRSDEEMDKEEKYMQEVSVTQPCSDPQGRWLKKGKKNYFGYKKHTCSTTRGLVLGIHTTTANESDTKHLETVLDKCELPENCAVNADKGYSSQSNRTYLKSKRYKSRIQHKAAKGKPLSFWQKTFNLLVSKKRYTVERTFGSINPYYALEK